MQLEAVSSCAIAWYFRKKTAPPLYELLPVSCTDVTGRVSSFERDARAVRAPLDAHGRLGGWKSPSGVTGLRQARRPPPPRLPAPLRRGTLHPAAAAPRAPRERGAPRATPQPARGLPLLRGKRRARRHWLNSDARR